MGDICLYSKVKQLKKDFLREDKVVELPQHSKQKLIDEILVQLRGLDAGANATQKRGVYNYDFPIY